MFFEKQIEGKIVECIVRREYMLPRRFVRSCRNFEYEHGDEFEMHVIIMLSPKSLQSYFNLGEEKESKNLTVLH